MTIERSVKISIKTNEASRNLAQLDKNLKKTERQADSTSNSTVALSGAIAGLASAATVRQIGQYADTFTGLQNRLKLVTDSSEELVDTSDRLLSISQDTRNSLEGTVDLYSRLARSTDSLGISSERLFAVTESVNQAIAISGSSAASAEAALFQLGQGLSAGALRGEELNSVLEQTPRLAESIADGLGVSIAQLRELGSEGELTAERVIQALESQAAVLANEYAKTESTIGQAFQKINDQLLVYIGNADKSTGATKSLVSSLTGVSDNFNEIADTTISVLVPAVTTLALVYSGRLAGSIATATTARIADTAAIVKQTIAERALLKAEVDSLAIKVRQAQAEVTQTKNRLANAAAIAKQSGNLKVLSQAQTAAAAAQQRLIGITAAQTTATQKLATATSAAAVAARGLSSAVAFVGGPAGAATIAAIALTTYISTLETAADKTKKAKEETDQFIASLQGASIIQFTNALRNSEDALDSARLKLKATENQIKILDETVGSGSKSIADNLRAQLPQLEADVVNAETALNSINRTFSESAIKAQELGGAIGGGEANSLIDVYSGFRKELDQAFAINQKYDALIKDIRKNVTDAGKATELISLAEKNRSKELSSLNRKIERQNKNTKKQQETYKDLLGVFDPIVALNNEYEKTIERINKSSATDVEKTRLRRLAQEDLNESIKKTNESLNKQEKQTKTLSQAFEDYAKDALDATDEIADAGENAIKGLEDALVEFTKTGKLSFKDLVTSILADIARIQIRQNITGPLSEVLGSIDFGGLFGGDIGADSAASIGNGFTLLAKGGIVDSPTLMGSSGGRPAIAGEAGPEAVLPLSRTSSGDLGVMSIGGNQPITIEIINQSSGEVQSNVQETIGANGDRQIRAIIQDSVKEGLGAGTFDRQLKTNFGVNRRGV